ncbi:PREDICTED: uncharacterized protein LOC109234775 [Nicotiana attenuata]|uniref:uncharacterized protein LOC109234775 n=1 Tax=Nicotiana attenuata TaxID=49451 RepID=UPI0009046724|nr:PREDICTED: uncharacterized protein LOC109234775 [Nicotiana attenuata]
MPFEQPAQDDSTGAPNNESDPSMENPGVILPGRVDTAPYSHFDAESLNMVVPKTNPESEEEPNDLVYASFIMDRTKPVVSLEPPPKRPTTWLQQNKALEIALKKSKNSRRRRRLVKDGNVVQVEDVPVVDVDEETKKEPSSLSRNKKLARSSGYETVKEGGDKSDEEELEKSSEHRESKSVEKEKFVGKSVKRKWDDDDDNMEPRSVKKGKVSETLRSEKRKLENQKVLCGRTFASDILESAGMRQLVDIFNAQQWTNLFTSEAAIVYKDEVRSFYTSLFTVDGDQICVLGACTPNFRNAIFKDKAVQHGEHVHKNALFPVYQLLFEMVNKVFLPRAERKSIESKADLFLTETLENFSSINLPAIMIEHMQKVGNLKDGSPGLPYGFFLTKVFEFFKVPLGQAKVGTKKQSFSRTTLKECECIDKFGGVGSTSTISQLINAQNNTTEEIRKLKARKMILENQLSQLQEVPGSSGSHSAMVARLSKENADLRKHVEDLKERLLNEQLSMNARMDLVLQTLASSS